MRVFKTLVSVPVFLAVLVGCALSAKKLPTPAAQLTGAELAELPKPEDERYFIVFFGSQDFLRRPKYTHTSAALIRVPASEIGEDGTAIPGKIDPKLEVHTISWLPVSGKIDAASQTVEPGRNFELHETMKLAVESKQSIAVWGPYEVWHGFAHRFMTQKKYLDSGTVGYQCVDSRGEAAERGNGCDCIHAITDMDPLYPRWGYPLLYFGKSGTSHALRRFMHSPIWISLKSTHDWLLPRLGLDAYPIEKRHYIGACEEHNPKAPADLDVVVPSLALPITPDGKPQVVAPAKTGKKPMEKLGVDLPKEVLLERGR